MKENDTDWREIRLSIFVANVPNMFLGLAVLKIHIEIIKM